MGEEEKRITGKRWSTAGDPGELQHVAGRRRRLREREGEVKALAEALKGQEGVRREVACGHLAVGLLVAAQRTLAFKAADQQVDTGAAVLADSRSTAARAGRQLTALSWTQRGGWTEMRINIVGDKQHPLSHPCGFHLGESTLLDALCRCSGPICAVTEMYRYLTLQFDTDRSREKYTITWLAQKKSD